MEIEGDEAAQQALRFAVYHLNSAANPSDERVSIGARALTGDDYRGHVFWDTEIYMLPFFVLTWPEAARALLMYRFHTLDGARAKAAGMGWRGALYAWEFGRHRSGDDAGTGDRARTGGSIDVLCGKQEQHISADVAYAVWQYWQATGDEAFLLDAGAEDPSRDGRFWSSRARLEADGHRHIRGVIGPDEYHEHIDDNAYHQRHGALEHSARARHGGACCASAGRRAGRASPPTWAGRCRTGAVAECRAETHGDRALIQQTGLFEQFAGYFDLEDIDLSSTPAAPCPWTWSSAVSERNRSQVVKQADVVALLGLLPEEFPARRQRRISVITNLAAATAVP